jgi:hypothetical protein
MRREADFFQDQEMDLLYIGKRLRDAQKLEGILDAALFDYAVEPDSYQGGVVFRTERVGAFFYVLPAELERARLVLKENGFKPHQL